MKKFLLAGALALALTACATTPSTSLTEGKVIADAWSAFDAASVTLDGLAKSGVLTAGEKATIASVGPQIESALTDATTAYNGGNNATATQEVAAATTLTAELVAIVGAHK